MKSLVILGSTGSIGTQTLDVARKQGYKIKALCAPYGNLKFIPTGGVNNDNIEEFLAWDKIEAVGGSFFVDDAIKCYKEKNNG